MASLAVCNNFFALSSNVESSIFAYSSEQKKKYKLQIPQYSEARGKDCINSEFESDFGCVITEISPSGSSFAVCSGKKLTIWSTSKWLVLSSREIIRAASSIKFTPTENHIVLADKSGDVYLFSLADQEPGKIILGHLSVILDVLISSDERYIITCDRDEKIRVSNFPNAYNIHCFCLGHKEFVSSIKFIPDFENVLISGSGDGAIKCWNYTNGVELSSYLLDLLPSHVISENHSPLAIDSVNILKINQFTSIICVDIPYLCKIVVLLLEQNNNALSFNFHSAIDIRGVLSICALNSHLWILTSEVKSRIVLFKWENKEEGFKSDQTTINKLRDDAEEELKNYNIFKKQDSFDYLFKKKYDNVKEYLMKKKARLEGSL